ncbi:MAG: outer membrane lipoprotein LolB [Burkholderiaceae bacterium]
MTRHQHQWLRGYRHARYAITLGMFIMLTALSGCASLTPVVVSPEQVSGQWAGRFSVTVVAPDSGSSEEPSKEDRAQGRFELTRQAGQLDLALFSPFGQTLATAVSNADGASLTTSAGQTYQAQTTPELIEKALGWRLPVDALPGWLSGNRLATDDTWVIQDGWRVRIEKRLASGKPRILAARWPARPTHDKRELKLLVVVDGR